MKRKLSALVLVSVLTGALTAIAVPAAAETQVIQGNPTCADVAGDSIEMKDDPPTLHQRDFGHARVAYFDIFTVSGVADLSHEFDIVAVIVKGGPAATVVIGGPYTNISAPALDNGVLPEISHVSVCLEPKEPTDTSTTSTTEPEDTTTTTEGTSTSDATTTTSTPTTPPTEGLPPSTSQATTTTTVPPTDTTVPPSFPTTVGTTSPPSTTTPPTTPPSTLPHTGPLSTTEMATRAAAWTFGMGALLLLAARAFQATEDA